MEKARLWQQTGSGREKRDLNLRRGQKSEREAFKKLMKDVRRWKQAELIREYVVAIPQSDPQWFEWAQAKADWLDPYNPMEDNWLQDVDIDHF